MHDRVSTGISGFDRIIDGLRLGDNVVWQVDSIQDYRRVVEPYVAQARHDGRKLVYVRFGSHEPLLEDGTCIRVCHVDPTHGFEHFATEVHNLVEREGKKAFYVFDSLTDLLQYWYPELLRQASVEESGTYSWARGASIRRPAGTARVTVPPDRKSVV